MERSKLNFIRRPERLDVLKMAGTTVLRESAVTQMFSFSDCHCGRAVDQEVNFWNAVPDLGTVAIVTDARHDNRLCVAQRTTALPAATYASDPLFFDTLLEY